MDPLALLCTLHADGPATLQRLRAAGCGGLAAVQALGAEELGGLLGVPPAAARRFLREARHLGQRLDAELLDPDEVLGGVVGALGTGRARAGGGARPPSAGAEDAAVVRTPGPGPSSTRALLDRVLESWRCADTAPGEPGRPAPDWAERSAEAEPAATRGRGTGPSEEIPDGAPPQRAPELTSRLLDGLDGATCAALLAAGVRDLAMLARAEPLALAGLTGLGFSSLTRLAFLARRALGLRPVAATTPAARPADEPRAVAPPRAPTSPRAASEPSLEPPRVPRFGEGVGGPFA